MFKFSQNIRELFLKHKDNIELPFFYSFPKNSCESAAHFLAALLAQNFPEDKFYVVHGYKRTTDENHFWIEVNEKVIDITADQFRGVNSPIYGATQHPLASKFIPITKTEAVEAFKNYDLIENEKKIEVYNFILSVIQREEIFQR